RRVRDDHQFAIVRDGEYGAAQGNVAGRGVGHQGGRRIASGDIHIHQALIAAKVNARRRHMVKHHGIGSARQVQDLAYGAGSWRHRKHRAVASNGVAAAGRRGPGGIGERLGGRGWNYINGDRAITFGQVWWLAFCGRRGGRIVVAGVDGETGDNSSGWRQAWEPDIASWGSTGSG